MLSTISSEPFMSSIGNFLSHSSGKWHDSLTMAALSFTNGCSEFHFVQYLFTNISLATA